MLKYKAIPRGIIKEGKLTYSLDVKKAQIEYDGYVVGKILFFTKKFETSGVYKVDLNQMKSSNVAPGHELAVGDVNFVVLSVGNDKTARISFEIEGQDLDGEALVDISKEYLEVISLKAVGTIKGQSVQLEIVKA